MLLQLVELDASIAEQEAKSLNCVNQHKTFDDLSAEEPAHAFANINLRTAVFVNCILVSFFRSSARECSQKQTSVW